MNIKLNGSDYITSAVTISELLTELNIQADRVAVEKNLSIVKRTDIDKTTLENGDTIEIVMFVGGG